MPRAAVDREHMLRAIELAERGRFTAHPNPLVGAVVVDPAGRVVGEGYHVRKGGSHAEALALAEAGPAARGSTVYVTLEPHNHMGTMPPCTEALLAAGVARVVVALVDPNPLVMGSGIDRLRHAGVEVEVGVAGAEAVEQNRDYIHHATTGLPWVVAKSAISIEGLAAAPDGTSQWITGEAARADGHHLRAAADAVMVGSGTWLADQPRLTVRMDGYDGPQPLRVVMDRRGRIDGQRPGPDLVYRGSLTEALADLGGRGVVNLLVEGGPTLSAALSAAGLVDEYVVYMAPLALAGAVTLADGRRLRLASHRPVGADVRIEFRRPHPPLPRVESDSMCRR
jgi:diaminohydroxyphosphoribosylaminopyrimidine deaminase/5-amino-6-(5-phosphoribosylamino)uracil reductase